MEALLYIAVWAGLIHDGNVHYFCSRECRDVFETAPDFYVGGRDPNHPRLQHSHA